MEFPLLIIHRKFKCNYCQPIVVFSPVGGGYRAWASFGYRPFFKNGGSPWELIGAEDNLLNGICSSGPYLFATTEEGLHYYNYQTGQWTDLEVLITHEVFVAGDNYVTHTTAGHALLRVFDLRGALVITLLDAEVTAGVHSYPWRPAGLGSGVYRTILEFGGKTVAGSVVLLK